MNAAAGCLPDGLEPYRRTDTFTEESVPSALLKEHSTKAGVWGLIKVESGQLRYCVTDTRRAPHETVLTPEGAPGVVEPTILHRVEPVGTVRFYVEFHRERVERNDGSGNLPRQFRPSALPRS